MQSCNLTGAGLVIAIILMPSGKFSRASQLETVVGRVIIHWSTSGTKSRTQYARGGHFEGLRTEDI